MRPPYPEETNMSPTIRSLVIPSSDLEASKPVYTALFGEPHTDQPYYVGYNVDGFEVELGSGRRGRRTGALRRRRGSRRHPRDPARGRCGRAQPHAQVSPEARVCVLADADGNPIGLRGR